MIVSDLPNWRANFTDSEVARFHDLTRQFLNIPFCPWSPSEVQSLFLLDFGSEAFYGGAVGGGKSIAILMSASQFLEVPGYSALLLRRTFADLNRPGALMEVAEEWWGPQLGKGVKFDRQKHTYIFDCPGGGHSLLEFGGLDTVNDRYKYQGGRYHFIGWDELTQFPERDYTYVSFSRSRRVSSGPLSKIPRRIRSTGNPGGVGHDWVEKRFILPYEAWLEGAKRPRNNFHPATLLDNPFLDREDYIKSLMNLDPVTRQQLLRGDWRIRPDGRMMKAAWLKPISRGDLPTNIRWVRGWDMASTDPAPGLDPDWTAGALIGCDRRTGRYYIADMRHWRTGPGDNDVGCQLTSDHDTRQVEQIMEQEPGASGKIAIHHYRTGPFRRARFRGVPASGKARGRVTTVQAGRKTSPAKIMAAGPFASKAEAGLVYYVQDASWDWQSMLNEIDIFPDGEHDDQVDAIGIAVNWLDRRVSGDANPGQANEGLDKGAGPALGGWRPEALPPGMDGDPAAMARMMSGDETAGAMWQPDLVESDRSVEERIAQIWDMN